MKKITKVESASTNRKRKKTKLENVFINTLAIVLFGGAIAWIILTIYSQEKSSYEAQQTYKSSLPKPGKAVQHNLVCMVNNMYMGTGQIAVLINEKTYYGCCPKCVKDLNTDENTRFASDPFSKKKVDKAMAFIIINPDMTGAVLYFESEQNVKKYLKI